MAELGMDPQAVLAIAKKIDQQRQSTLHVSSVVDKCVAQARGVWRGSDVDRFAAQWAAHKADLRNAAAALGELATKARTNAQAQIRTSNEYAAGGAAGGGAAGGGSAGGGGGGGGGGAGGEGGNHEPHGEFHYGPHGEFDQKGHLGPIPLSVNGSGEVGLHGEGSAHADIDGNHIDVGADGKFLDGAHGEVNSQVGNEQWNVHNTTEGTVGLSGDGSASVTADDHGATIDAHGEVLDGARVETTTGFTTPVGSVDSTTAGTVGLFAKGDIGSHAGTDGVSAHYGYEAFDGAKIEQGYSYHVGPFSGGASADLLAGEGVGQNTGVSLTSHDVGIDFGAEVSEELGLGAKGSFHVDPTALGHDVAHVVTTPPWKW